MAIRGDNIDRFFFRNKMTCAHNTCKNESAVKNDLVNYTHNFTQAVDVSYFFFFLKLPYEMKTHSLLLIFSLLTHH